MLHCEQWTCVGWRNGLLVEKLAKPSKLSARWSRCNYFIGSSHEGPTGHIRTVHVICFHLGIREVLRIQIWIWHSWSGWWFGTCFSFPYIGNDNNPNWRTHISQRGRSTTNQLWCSAGFSTFPPPFCRSQRPRPGRLAPHPRCGWPDAGRWRAMSLAQAQLEWTWIMDMNVANLTINHPRNIPRW
jgi:hypothetical protein